MTEFCSDDFAVWESPAPLKRSIEVILSIEQKQSYCEVLESVPAVSAKLSWNFCLQFPCWKPTRYHRFVDILSRFNLFGWLVSEKIAICLQRPGTKYRCFIWAKRSTARRAVMVHSARSIALLLASFDVALPSERKKSSWIDWTIEVSPCTRWFLLGRFPARRSRFRVSHHATYCARRSLTSYRPVMHACSHFGVRVRRRHIMRETTRAPPQVPQHFDDARANGPIFVPPVDLISFT